MKMFSDQLTKLGMSVPEAKVYEALLRFGESSATALSERTGLGRTNVYDYVANLERNGLVRIFEKNSKTHYAPESPTLLADMAAIKLKEAKDIVSSFSEILPKLEEFYDSATEKPSVDQLSGSNVVSKVIEEIISDNVSGVIFVATPDLDTFDNFDPKYRNKMLRRQLFTNIIANKGKVISEYQLRDQRELRTTLLCDPKAFEITSEYLISDDTIYYGRFSHERPSLTRVVDKSLAEFLKTSIQLAMRSAKIS